MRFAVLNADQLTRTKSPKEKKNLDFFTKQNEPTYFEDDKKNDHLNAATRRHLLPQLSIGGVDERGEISDR